MSLGVIAIGIWLAECGGIVSSALVGAIFFFIIGLHIVRQCSSDESFGSSLDIFALRRFILTCAHGVAPTTIARRNAVDVGSALNLLDGRQRIGLRLTREELALLIARRRWGLCIRIHNASDGFRGHAHGQATLACLLLFVLFLALSAAFVQTATLGYFVWILAVTFVALWRGLLGILQLDFGTLGLLARRLKRRTHGSVALGVCDKIRFVAPKCIEQL